MDVGAGQPDAAVVDGQHPSMSPAQKGRADRIGSLFDGACPTAATPATGRTERLPHGPTDPGKAPDRRSRALAAQFRLTTAFRERVQAVTPSHS